MHLDTETAELRQLVIQLQSAGGEFTPQVAGQILLDAAKPLLIAMEQEVPIGKVPKYESSVVVRGRRKGQSRTNSGYYARGGALRRSLRIKSVQPEGAETARVIAGASKASGQVGWRAHFKIGGTVKMAKDDFLTRADDRTRDVVVQRVANSSLVIIRKKLKRLSV